MELLFFDIAEYQFSRHEENALLLPATLCVDFSLYTILSFPLSVEIFLERIKEHVNDEELYPVLTNKSFSSFHENKDSSLIKIGVVGDTTLSPHRWILPSLQSPLSLTSHTSLPGKPTYELPPPEVLCCVVLVMSMQYRCQVKGRTGNMSFKFFTQGLTRFFFYLKKNNTSKINQIFWWPVIGISHTEKCVSC